MSDLTKHRHTYDDPGPCPKCGYPYPQVWWQDPTDSPFSEFGEKPTGQLTAKCRNCGYAWRILAKDEIG